MLSSFCRISLLLEVELNLAKQNHREAFSNQVKKNIPTQSYNPGTNVKFFSGAGGVTKYSDQVFGSTTVD
jgi:hypothetical protein